MQHSARAILQNPSVKDSRLYHQAELQGGGRTKSVSLSLDSMVLLALQPSLALRHEVNISALIQLHTNVRRIYK